MPTCADHGIFLDGVFVADADGVPAFRLLPRRRTEEVADLRMPQSSANLSASNVGSKSAYRKATTLRGWPGARPGCRCLRGDRGASTPGIYFRSLLLDFFEGIDSERGICVAGRRLAEPA